MNIKGRKFIDLVIGMYKVVPANDILTHRSLATKYFGVKNSLEYPELNFDTFTNTFVFINCLFYFIPV